MDYKEIYLSTSKNQETYLNEKVITALEDLIALYQKPVIIVSEYSLRPFVSVSGKYKRNPYAYTVRTGVYYFYGETFRVEVVKLTKEEINRCGLCGNYNKIIIIDEKETDKTTQLDFYIVDDLT